MKRLLGNYFAKEKKSDSNVMATHERHKLGLSFRL